MAMNQKTNQSIIVLLVVVIIGLFSVIILDDELSVASDRMDSNQTKQFSAAQGMFDPQKEYAVTTFSSTEELSAFLETSSTQYGRMAGGYAIDSVSMEFTNDAVARSESSVKSTSPLPDYSETNVQEEGIDESDIFKTDGTHIYTITDGVVFIIEAYPADAAEVVSVINISGRPQSLFIKDDILVVFGSVNDMSDYTPFGFQERDSLSFITLYDISDPSEPEAIKEYQVEGHYFEGRMKGDTVYLLMRSSPNRERPTPLPIIVEDGMERTIPVDRIHYYPLPYSNPQFVNIYSFSVENPQESLEGQSVAVEGHPTVYMSDDNLYMVTTERINEYELEQEIQKEVIEPYLTDEDVSLISRIETIDSAILSPAEKERKIQEIYMQRAASLDRKKQEELMDEAELLLKERLDSYDHLEYTLINKFSLDGTEVTPTEHGKVPGHVNNQFALDEKDGVFRLATTISARWSRFEKQQTKSTNNVYTLSERLDILDSLEGLAPDESIYATRFIDDRLYMVTFRQVDPFYVIGLSDPQDIRNLGELKIPGFSRYLHPYDDTTIIGIGKDATETGRTTGLKIALYDVSDVTNPKEHATFVTDERYANSNALYEHKAFLFSKEKNLLVIPAYSYDYQDQGSGYNGAFVFTITKDKVALRGLIDHTISGGSRYWQPQVERSAYIDDMLYTKSPHLLRINDIGTLEGVANITLEYSNPGIPIY